MTRILHFIVFIFLFSVTQAQPVVVKSSGTYFAAMTVSHADSTSLWYEKIFGMTLQKEIKSPDSRAHVRIIGNSYLQLEIIQHSDSKSVSSFGISTDNRWMVRGLTKFGLYVTNISEIEKYFRDHQVVVEHAFDDAELKIKSIIISDPNGLLIQFIQRIP